MVRNACGQNPELNFMTRVAAIRL